MTALTWKPYRKSLAGDLARVWNRALGEHFPLDTRLIRQNIEGAPSFQPEDSTIVLRGDDVAGFIVTKRFREQDPLLATLGSVGWIDALIVDPAHQRQGLGRDLLAWAVYRLRSNGAGTIHLASALRHFFPGVPLELPGLVDYFAGAGFSQVGVAHDLHGDLRGFVAPPSARAAVAAVDGVVHPCRVQDMPALHAFLAAEFPGRWRYDIARYLTMGGDPAMVIILRQGDAVAGFAQIHRAGRGYQGPPAYWRGVRGPRPGGLGPIGVAASMRGKGVGLALLQLALEEAARRGVEDGVIDWTSLLDFYARVGFAPWKSYARMESAKPSP